MLNPEFVKQTLGSGSPFILKVKVYLNKAIIFFFSYSFFSLPRMLNFFVQLINRVWQSPTYLSAPLLQFLGAHIELIMTIHHLVVCLQGREPPQP